MSDMSEFGQIAAHYASVSEQGRLATPRGIVEFERSCEIVSRRLPPPPAVVADIGGGPGDYSVWLARAGYQVHHRDLLELHVEQARAAALDAGVAVETAVGDARALDLADASVDAVLLFGPLYHLREREHRLAALVEASRVARPGAPVFVAAISRWAARLDGVVLQRLYEERPEVTRLISEVERTGYIPAEFTGSFTAYAHRPQELLDEIAEAGFQDADLVAVEGVSFLLSDLEQRLSSPRDREVVFATARALERVPELLGLGSHLLATTHRSQ